MKPNLIHKHILVVEDEKHLAVGIKFNLEAEHYKVTAVGDGPAALRAVQDAENPVDLVVLDLMLPGMSGYAVCETLRQSGHHMPILMLTARTLTEDRTRGFEVGADQYLNKPFDLDELLARVRSLLTLHEQRISNARPGRRAASFEFAESTVNFESCEVVARGKRTRMTQLELKLLQYFIENEGRIVTRQELLEHVWEMPPYIATRAPDQFIRRLRKTFEPDPANPRHFLTIRDVGYRFIARPEETGEAVPADDDLELDEDELDEDELDENDADEIGDSSPESGSSGTEGGKA